MLAAKYRFHGHGALKFVFGHGRTYRFKSLSIRTAQNPRRTLSRASVVVSKKVVKAAPGRNRIRRRIYEILRLAWPHLKTGHDIVISVYDPSMAIVEGSVLESEIHKCLQAANLWSNKLAATETANSKTGE